MFTVGVGGSFIVSAQVLQYFTWHAVNNNTTNNKSHITTLAMNLP